MPYSARYTVVLTEIGRAMAQLRRKKNLLGERMYLTRSQGGEPGGGVLGGHAQLTILQLLTSYTAVRKKVATWS